MVRVAVWERWLARPKERVLREDEVERVDDHTVRPRAGGEEFSPDTIATFARMVQGTTRVVGDGPVERARRVLEAAEESVGLSRKDPFE